MYYTFPLAKNKITRLANLLSVLRQDVSEVSLKFLKCKKFYLVIK